MPTIEYNKVRLRQAVVLLLDYQHGQGRIEKVRDAINRLPEGRRFYGGLAPLNELVAVAAQDVRKAECLVDLAATHRIKLREESVAAAPKLAERRRKARENTARYRERLNKACAAREVRLGRPMTKEESDDFLLHLKDEWSKRRAGFVRAHSELTRIEALSKFADILDAEMEAELEKAVEDARRQKEAVIRRQELRKPSDHVLRA